MTAALVALWWLTLAPSVVGGPTSYTLVDGHSMEPMLYTGDLVFSRSANEYAVGDLVVFVVGRGHVIHKLLAGDSQNGWQTQGVNNSWVDPWVVPNADILGRYWVSVPGFSSKLQWPQAHPLAFGALCGGAAMLTYFPWRRRRIVPQLASALADSEPEPPAKSDAGGEGLLLGLGAAGCVLGLMALANVMASRVLISAQGAVVVITLAFSGSLTTWLAMRRFDGRGLAEPAKSLHALAGRLRRVEAFPELPEEERLVDVKSAAELALIAEKYRLPVLHVVSADQRLHGFLVITAKRGSYYWEVEDPAPGEHADTAKSEPRRRPDLSRR